MLTANFQDHLWTVCWNFLPGLLNAKLPTANTLFLLLFFFNWVKLRQSLEKVDFKDVITKFISHF